jgi:hypothetical protein
VVQRKRAYRHPAVFLTSAKLRRRWGGGRSRCLILSGALQTGMLFFALVTLAATRMLAAGALALQQ